MAADESSAGHSAGAALARSPSDPRRAQRAARAAHHALQRVGRQGVGARLGPLRLPDQRRTRTQHGADGARRRRHRLQTRHRRRRRCAHRAMFLLMTDLLSPDRSTNRSQCKLQTLNLFELSKTYLVLKCKYPHFLQVLLKCGTSGRARISSGGRGRAETTTTALSRCIIVRWRHADASQLSVATTVSSSIWSDSVFKLNFQTDPISSNHGVRLHHPYDLQDLNNTREITPLREFQDVLEMTREISTSLASSSASGLNKARKSLPSIGTVRTASPSHSQTTRHKMTSLSPAEPSSTSRNVSHYVSRSLCPRCSNPQLDL